MQRDFGDGPGLANGLSRRQVIAGGAALGAAISAGSDSGIAQEAKPTTAGDAEPPPSRAILELAPGIYRTQENRHFGLLVEADDGLLVFDTLGADFAGWLDAEIARRFAKPVRYVVYSHNHADHTGGGQAFAHHNPRYVSHRLARDSHVRMQVDTRPADQTFDEAYQIQLGGRQIDLRYHGPNDGRGSISLYVPDARLLSAVDWIVIGRLPYKELNRYDLEGTIRSLREVERMDFDIVSPGHADVGDKSGVVIERRYLETLRDAVIEHIFMGTPMDLVVSDVTDRLRAVPEFAALKQFDAWVADNIKGAHYQLARIEGRADGVLPDPAYAAR